MDIVALAFVLLVARTQWMKFNLKLMARIIYTLLLIFAFVVAAPSAAMAESMADDIEQSQAPSVAVVSGSQLRVVNANGQILRVYNVTGVQVRVLKVEGQDKCYDLNLQKGCYIVKVGKMVRKISVK